eukprot:jgi/Psemu1/38034/gm1.38034_g
MAATINGDACFDGAWLGFNNGRFLNPEQLAFRNSLMDFGINQESADEIMRGGMSNIREITDLNKESIKSFMLGLKSIRPDCPYPDSIHYGNRLSSRLLTWANWARYQPLIGVKPRAIDWNANPDNLKLQQFRIKMMQSSEKSQEKATLPELKDLSKFREWEEGFCQNLRYRFNSEGFPILYVIRPQEKEEVDDEARNGTVVMNDVVCCLDASMMKTTMLYGGCCVTRLGKGQAGNMWPTFKTLNTNITMVLNKTYQDMKESHYTGDARNYDWNKHKRNWTAFHGTIMRFEKNHNERRFVWDFINSISDERLDAANANAIDESKDYRDSFNDCLILFTNRLGLKKLANAKNNKKKRALTAAETKKAKEAEKEGAGDSFGSKS